MLYNPNLPILVSTDASPVGLGAVLSHQITVNGELVERPVAYASCALIESQQRYSQLDREALTLNLRSRIPTNIWLAENLL